LIIALALAASLPGALPSQQETPSAAKLRFTVFSPGQIAGLSYAAVAKPALKISPLIFFPNSRSPVYDYAGPMPLQFMDEKSGEIVASVDVPAEIQEPLLVFFPLQRPSDRGLRFHVYVHDDAKTRHGAGGLAVLNFSGLALSGTLDHTHVEWQDGYYGPYAVGASAAMQLSTLFRARKIQSYAETVALGKNGRALLILLPPFRKGSLEIQSRVLLDEIVPVKKAGTDQR
jgi:hypothetical protein